MSAINVLCAQLTRDLFAIAKFLFILTFQNNKYENSFFFYFLLNFCNMQNRNRKTVLLLNG